MNVLEFAFWISACLVFYAYLGYGIMLFFLVKCKRTFSKDTAILLQEELPDVTLLIAAYNEEDFVYQKMQNSRDLFYPAGKLHIVWVTDGSTDQTVNLLKRYKEGIILHSDKREGKVAAINRAMKYIVTPVVIFSDANTLLGKYSVSKIVELFANPKVGCVSGEKRIAENAKDVAAGSGEGFYWKYESALKRWDAELNTAVGAAGELFAIRTELFKEVETDTILDDFIISLRITMEGYKIGYTPEAYAVENASANVKEELKRKVRIAAGGIQSVFRLSPLLNIFKYKLASFQNISHRVLRWTIAPLLLPLLVISSYFLIPYGVIYSTLFLAQTVFYILAFTGWVFENRKLRVKGMFIPYYFVIMNYAVYRGQWRYFFTKQSAAWERSKRAM